MHKHTEAVAVAAADITDIQASDNERQLAERQRKLMIDARASFKSMSGWDSVTSEEDWQEIVKNAAASLDDGTFLLERLGADRFVDPPQTAVLLTLRRRLIDEYHVATSGDLMIVDSIVLSYYHMFRVNGWIGNLSVWLEAEFFGHESLSAKMKRKHGTTSVRGLTAEDLVQQIVERLMPLVDRSNRMMLRNLKELKEHRHIPATTVAIEQAG